MEAIKQKVLNLEGKEVGSVDLDPEVFGVKPAKGLVHETVVWQLAKRRAGTHSTLNRKRMTGGGRKPYRQKGTGNARAGTRNSPVWVGGAVAHGPTPRSYLSRLSKRSRRQALAAALSSKVSSSQLIVVDSLTPKTPKTKEMAGAFSKLGVLGSKVTLVVPESGDVAQLASRNISGVRVLKIGGVNVYDVLNGTYLVCEQADIAALTSRVKGSDKAKQEN